MIVEEGIAVVFQGRPSITIGVDTLGFVVGMVLYARNFDKVLCKYPRKYTPEP